MNKKIFFIFLLLVLVSVSAAKAEGCYLSFSDNETYISLLDLDNYNQLQSPIDSQYRQNDNLLIDKIHIVITNPYPDRWYCDINNYTGININIRQVGSNTSQLIFSYLYGNLSNNTIDISIQKENLTLSNRKYIMDGKEIFASDIYFSLNNVNEYQMELVFFGTNNDNTVYYESDSYQPIIRYSPSLSTYTFRVLSYVDFQNLRANIDSRELARNAIRLSSFTMVIALISAVIGTLSLWLTVKIHKDNLKLKNLKRISKSLMNKEFSWPSQWMIFVIALLVILIIILLIMNGFINSMMR